MRLHYDVDPKKTFVCDVKLTKSSSFKCPPVRNDLSKLPGVSKVDWV